MHGIYELKEMLCKELEEYGTKGELSTGTLEIVDKLAHTVKNLDKIIESYEEEEGSYAYDDGMSYEGGRSMNRGGGSYERGRSYARGRGGNARRNSRGRYSSEGYSRTGDMVEQLRDLMRDAPDERTRQEIQRLVTKMEQQM